MPLERGPAGEISKAISQQEVMVNNCNWNQKSWETSENPKEAMEQL